MSAWPKDRATRIAWYLNLDADRELEDPVRYQPLARADVVSRIGELIGAEDVILGEADPGDRIALAFCPTPRALAAIRGYGLAPPDAPPIEVLQRVNDRAFCAELGHGLPRSSFVRDLDALERFMATPSPTGNYVLKRAFSFAGRERLRVSALDAASRGFCRRSFDRGHGVQCEPWVERLGDYSRHGWVAKDGTLSIGPTREQKCDPMGRWLGAGADVVIDEDALLERTAVSTAQALHAAGYFGPFGIDAFRYRSGNGTAFNARCEINARFTMNYPRALLERAL